MLRRSPSSTSKLRREPQNRVALLQSPPGFPSAYQFVRLIMWGCQNFEWRWLCFFFQSSPWNLVRQSQHPHQAKQTTRSNMLKAACVTRNFTAIDLSSCTVKAIALQQQTAMSFAVSGLSSWLSYPNQGRARTLCLCSSQQHLTKPHSGSVSIWSQVDTATLEVFLERWEKHWDR